jgi:hypothetical protein
MAARFAESRSLAWGGHVGYALPYSRSAGLREPWRQLLDLLDPDEVVALGTSREPAVSPRVLNFRAPRQEPAKLLVDRIGDDLGRLVYTAEGPERLFISASTLMHSVLRAVGEHLKPPDSEHFVVAPRLSRRSSAYLPVMARYGGVDDAEVTSVLNEVHSDWYRFDLNLSKSVQVKKLDATSDLLGVLTGDMSGLLGNEEPEPTLTLPELTLLGLQITGRASPHLLCRERAGDRQEIRYRPIVVTGKDNSVEDFALFWNLRSEHYFAKPFPIWIPLDLLEDARAPAAIQKALARFRPAVGKASPRIDDLLIVSTSMCQAELRERLGNLYPEVRIGADNLIGLFTATSEYRYTTEKLPAHFDRGRTSLQPPRPEELKNLIPGVDYVAYEVGVDGMCLPQSRAMAWHLGWPDFHSRDNVSKRGNLRFVKQFNKEFSERDLLDVRTPDGWTLLRSVFEERGYDVVPTAKAAAALGQLELIGGTGNLKVLASSKVRELLRVLSRRRGERRPFVAERKTLKFEHFRARWGREAARDVLRWLVERRVVFRGAVLECPRCRLSGWYAVDRVGEVWRCDGCQEDFPVPLDPDKTEWHYRINELYAHGHNQGTLTPLLTLHAMAGAWGGRPSGEGLGFYPGVELTAKEGACVPFPKKEVDLVALRGRDLVLAECKESTEYLAAPEKAAQFARQLADTVALADHLGAAELLVASSTTFPVGKETLLREVPDNHSVKLLWLDGSDLLDPYFFANPLTFPGASDGARKPKGWDEEYLELLRRDLADTSS